MNPSFNFFNNKRIPTLTLCNPNGEEMYALGTAKNITIEIALNSLSELTFEVPMYIDKDVIQPYYDSIKTKRLVNVDGYGTFIITNVDTSTEGNVEIKSVTCKGLEFELSSRNLDILEGTYALYNPNETLKSILHIVLGYIPTWTIGSVDPSLLNTWRTFDIKDNNIFNFLMGEVQEAFDCIFTFDTTNRTISATKTSNLKKETDIYMSGRNLVKQLNITENSDNIITALNVYGDGDLSIRGVNPIGTATIYDFSYYKNREWMTDSLINAITIWEDKIKKSEIKYSESFIKINNLNKELLKLKSQLTDLISEKKALEQKHSLAVVANDNEKCSLYSQKIKEKQAEIDSKQKEVDSKQLEITNVEKELQEISKTVSFNNCFTQEQIKELNNFIYQASVQNTNFSTTDLTTPQERREIMLELYKWGKDKLERSSQPILEFSLEAINFLNLVQYKDVINQLNLGSEITIEVDKEKDLYAKVLLLGYRIGLDTHDDMVLNFSSVLNFKSATFTFEELFDATASISKSFDFESKDWGLGKKAHNKIDEYINSALDLTTKEIQATENQEFTITSVGIRGKEKNPENDTYLPEEIWINKNTIAFSDDNFNTTKMALGKIVLPDGTRGYGLIGDYIVGRVLCGQKLILENEQSTFRVDGDKVFIKNADIVMTSTTGKEETLEEALKYASENGGSTAYHQSTPPEKPREGDIWYDTSNNDKPKVYINGVWKDASDKDIEKLKDQADQISIDLAKNIETVYESMEEMKQAIKDGEITIFYQGGQPTTPKEGDIWYDTDDKNKAYIYKDSQWKTIQDQNVIDALEQAGNAQATADSKIKTYCQPNEPKGLSVDDFGDLWFDTDDGNKLYRWSGTEWVVVRDKGIDQVSSELAENISKVYNSMEEMKQAIKDGEITIFYQKDTPSNPKEGDIWYDTDDKNKGYIYKEGSWKTIQDQNVIDALEQAGNAQATADGKIKTYWQPNEPSPMNPQDAGDLWIDTDDKNKLYRYDGSSWKSIQDGTIADVSNKVNTIVDSNGNISASKMVGHILTGKTNIVCATEGTTGNVLALNENGIIVGTKNGDGSINTSGGLTCITKDGIVADAICSGGTIQGVTIKGSKIIAGNENGVYTLLDSQNPLSVYRGTGKVVELWGTSDGSSYLNLYDRNGEQKFAISSGVGQSSYTSIQDAGGMYFTINGELQITGQSGFKLYAWNRTSTPYMEVYRSYMSVGNDFIETYIDGKQVIIDGITKGNVFSELDVKLMELEYENRQIALKQSELDVLLMERGIL